MKLDLTPQGSFTPFPAETLPDGFQYPKLYLQFATSIGFPTGLIWWFVSAQTPGGDLAWDNRLYWSSEGWRFLGEIDPIPFAKNGDWAAYFDGRDPSGDPAIVVADLGNRANAYRLDSFDAWLDRAREDSGLT